MADSTSTNAVHTGQITLDDEVLAGAFEIADLIQSEFIDAERSGLLMSRRITPSEENNDER